MVFLHVSNILQKIPYGRISIPEGENVERSIGSVSNFNSSKVPYEHFTIQYGPEPCKSYLVWTIKYQIQCRK